MGIPTRVPVLLLSLSVGVIGQTVDSNTITFDTRACQEPFTSLPYCNPSLSLDERVNDLIERVWNDANATSLIPQLLTARNMGKNALTSLGIPEFDYGLNCIHG